MNRFGIIRRYVLQAVCRCFFLAPAFLAAQQQYGGTDINALYAQEEFRVGVQAYNRFSFNEAILSFERALSFSPGKPLVLDWLGRAYYRSGLEETAIRQWRSAVAEYPPAAGEALLLNSRIETVRNRRSLLPIAEDGVRYVESGRYPGKSNDMVYYRHPTAVLPLEDGSAWIVAYGSNELVRVDVNGVIRQRQRGPLNGFDRPYDLVRGNDGRMFLSEYRGGRVSALNSNGDWQYYIGSKGNGDGQFVGPQNLAVDEAGYLYVVDYGNRRVSKFDPDGAFILSFGFKSAEFQGFLSPTGIAAKDGRVYVADGAARQIAIFDGNGTYLGILVKTGLTGPESLRFLSDGRLLVADTNRIMAIDVNSAVIRELGVAGNSGVRIVSAEIDRNGNIMAANFQGDEVSVMTRFTDMASGLFVQIDRVISERFPLITVEISVEDRLRRPIVGLDSGNFLLSEKGRAVLEQNFLGAGYRSESADIAILMERSGNTVALQEDLVRAMRDIADNFSGSVVSLVSAGEQPVKERLANGVSVAARGNAGAYTPRWRFDLGLRLAATDLLAGEKKRAVLFVGAGSLGELSFEQYSLAELGAYLANNGIVFHAIILGDGLADEKIRYLCGQTGGEVMSLYRPSGIGGTVRSIASRPSGSYILSYRSQLPTDFGRAYLPVEAEVYLMERSGRDSIGYYPPLE
ncbi:MAG: 6-bladed beta-propeller [Spirochaetaceae bacterium]|jgi:DNA-binding beta-propeller fold protein YncE|nr:6-bladed beta-propeller [Spirochaetaceae bacterium]